MNLIAAVDNNWAIGHKGRLLVTIPADHKRFREMTTGKVVVLGRKTMDTFPGKQPLKNRTNIVLSQNPDYRIKGALTANSIETLLDMIRDYPDEDVFIIGGESVYSAMIGYCDTAYITKINYSYVADAYFPNLSELPEWELVSESEEMTCFDIEYTFQTWKRAR
jgi:dihydrofolate reductase